jgi:hypothetical protein
LAPAVAEGYGLASNHRYNFVLGVANSRRFPIAM